MCDEMNTKISDLFDSQKKSSIFYGTCASQKVNLKLINENENYGVQILY